MHNVFNKFLEVLREDLEAFENKVAAANASGSSTSPTVPPVAGAPDATPPSSQPGSQNSSMQSQASDNKDPKLKELADRRTEYGIAWIVYMRFAQRAEGLKSKRAVFAKARKDRWTPWEVYEAAGVSLVRLVVIPTNRSA